jgi:hypothetical protein
MTNNLTPWIVLGLIVIVSLFWKGYIKMPSLARPPAPPVAMTPDQWHEKQSHRDPHTMTSHELGLLLASAVRKEAEQEVAAFIAKEAAEKIKATFSAPFVPATVPATPENQGGAESKA